MLKKEITYEGWDEEIITETFWFNISKIEAVKMLKLKVEWEELQARIGNSTAADLSPQDMEDLLRFVDQVIDLSYGVRVDSKRFDKDPEHLKNLKMTPAYDALRESIFTDEQSALSFISAVLPKSMTEGVDMAELTQTPEKQLEAAKPLSAADEKARLQARLAELSQQAEKL